MNNIIKLIASMAANLSGGLIKKSVNDRYENNMFSYQLYNCIVSFSAALFLLIMSDDLKISIFTVLLAILFGIITIIQQISNLYALENGPFAYTTVIISLSTLIPTLSGRFFGEPPISVYQTAGIILLVICFIFSVDFSGKKTKFSVKWFVYCIIAFFSTGIIGVMQKIHQSSDFKNELDGFLVTAFCFSFVFSGIYSIILSGKRKKYLKTSKRNILSFMPLFLMFISGLFVALNNKFNLFLSGVLPSIIFFPVVNGGGLILSTLSAIILFKEKLSLRQIIGIICGIASVVLLCINFN